MQINVRQCKASVLLTDTARHISLSLPTGAVRGEEGLQSDALPFSSLSSSVDKDMSDSSLTSFNLPRDGPTEPH